MVLLSSGALGGAEPRVQIGQDVVESLDSDAETNQVRRHARRQLFSLGQLRVRRRCRVDRQAPDVADIREMAEQLEALDETTPGLGAALDAEGEDGSATVREVFQLPGVPWTRFESGEAHPLDLITSLEPLGDSQGIGHMALHPVAERLEALQEQEGVQWRDRGAYVAQVLESRLQDVLSGPEGFWELREDEAVVARVRLGKVGEPSASGVVELPAV